MRWLLVVAMVGGLVACGSDGPAEMHTCQSDGGFEFRTVIESCATAVRVGQELTVEVGIATAAGTEAADLMFMLSCEAMQGGERRSGMAEEVELARLLDERGVCPGDTSRVTAD
jgi:hypothetical protein